MKPLASTHVDGILQTVRYIPPFSCNEQARSVRWGNQRERVRDSSLDETATLHPLPGDNSAVAPPDPIPNSEVKHSRADGSVA